MSSSPEKRGRISRWRSRLEWRRLLRRVRSGRIRLGRSPKQRRVTLEDLYPRAPNGKEELARARPVIVSKGLLSSARVDPPSRVTPGLLREPPPPPALPPEDPTDREIHSPVRQAGQLRGSPPLLLSEPQQALPLSQRGLRARRWGAGPVRSCLRQRRRQRHRSPASVPR